MTARLRRILSRAGLGLATAAVLLGGAEVALRLVLGAPEPILVRPFWSPGDPVFEERGGQVHPVFQGPDAVPPFSARPHPGRRRVLFFGGSSVRAGHLTSPREEFPARAEALLARRGIAAECLNLGRPGVDTSTLLPIAEAALALEPEVAVLYTGHNDIGNLTMVHLGEQLQRSWTYRAREAALGLRLYFEVERLVLRGSNPFASPARYPLDPGAVRAAEEAFPERLGAVADALGARGAAVVIALPVSNRVGAGPVGAGCPGEVPRAAVRVVRGVRRLDPEAVDPGEVEAALARAPECPDLLWLRGRHLLAAGETAVGHAALRRAIDLDPAPLRATSAVVEGARRAAAERGIPVVDLEAHGPAPEAWFLDELHLSHEGHRNLAEGIAAAVTDLLEPARPHR